MAKKMLSQSFNCIGKQGWQLRNCCNELVIDVSTKKAAQAPSDRLHFLQSSPKAPNQWKLVRGNVSRLIGGGPTPLLEA